LDSNIFLAIPDRGRVGDLAREGDDEEEEEEGVVAAWTRRTGEEGRIGRARRRNERREQGRCMATERGEALDESCKKSPSPRG